MFGCCGAERQKFKNGQGQLDQARLDKLTAEKKEAGWIDARVEKLRQCSCPCHEDGSHVLC
tara:strand:+ start:295 stop:477 length:183 start_codon:yes stop_codon:yes gene_type:complete